MSGKFEISAIITGHLEGTLAVPSLRSFWNSVDDAEGNGIRVEPLFVLDSADDRTRSVFEHFSRSSTSIMEVDLFDQGAARNVAVHQSTGNYVAFLDADDIWDAHWLTRAYDFIKDADDKHWLVHPEFNYFFEGQASIYRQIDQLDPEFDYDLLRINNYWDALGLYPRDCLERFPFSKRDIQNGWAFEDWHWNLQTIEGGYVHRIVPDTVLFKRRRALSQTIKASTSKSRVRPVEMFRYSNWPTSGPTKNTKVRVRKR